LENGEYEYLHKINLSCNSCDSGSFPFGGSIDYYNKGKEWLIDFKFSESSYSTDSYIPQLSAYAYFSEFGMKKVEGKWTMAMGPVRSISILKIHPVTFECSENVITTPLTKDEIFTKAKNLHDYKKHGKDNYAPGINCRWCTDKNCKLKMK